MKKRMHKFFAALVALVMLCGAVPLAAHAADWPPANAVPIALNDFTKVDIDVADAAGYFSFAPSKTELYSFGFAALAVTSRAKISLHAADGEKLWPLDADYGMDRLDYQMTAGAVYYFEVKIDDADATGKISVFAHDQKTPEERQKMTLNAVLKEAKAAPRLWVPTGKWLALQKAITAAQAVADDPKATQAQINLQVNTLQQAISAAKPFDGYGFFYRPGDFIKLRQYQWDGYSEIAQVLYIIQLPVALIWVPIHFLMIGVTWVIGWFI